MIKADLVEAVFQNDDGCLTQREAAELVDDVLNILKEALEQGQAVKISAFGSFNVRDKKQRQGRNPKTGAPIILAARRTATFKTSVVLKDRLNVAR